MEERCCHPVFARGLEAVRGKSEKEKALGDFSACAAVCCSLCWGYFQSGGQGSQKAGSDSKDNAGISGSPSLGCCGRGNPPRVLSAAV